MGPRPQSSPPPHSPGLVPSHSCCCALIERGPPNHLPQRSLFSALLSSHFSGQPFGDFVQDSNLYSAPTFSLNLSMGLTFHSFSFPQASWDSQSPGNPKHLCSLFAHWAP